MALTHVVLQVDDGRCIGCTQVLERDRRSAESRRAAIEAGDHIELTIAQARRARQTRLVHQAGQQLMLVDHHGPSGRLEADQRCGCQEHRVGIAQAWSQIEPSGAAIGRVLVLAHAGLLGGGACVGDDHTLELALGHTAAIGIGKVRTKHILHRSAGRDLRCRRAGRRTKIGDCQGCVDVHRGARQHVRLVALARDKALAAAKLGGQAGTGFHRARLPLAHTTELRVKQLHAVTQVTIDHEHLGFVGGRECVVACTRQELGRCGIDLEDVVARAREVDDAEIAHLARNGGVGQVQRLASAVDLERVDARATVQNHGVGQGQLADVVGVDDDGVVACTGVDDVGTAVGCDDIGAIATREGVGRVGGGTRQERTTGGCEDFLSHGSGHAVA